MNNITIQATFKEELQVIWNIFGRQYKAFYFYLCKSIDGYMHKYVDG